MQIGLAAAQTRALHELLGKALGDTEVAGFSGGDLVLTAQAAGGIYAAFEGESYLLDPDGTVTAQNEGA